MFSMAAAGLPRVADRDGQPWAAGEAGGLVTRIPRGGIMAPHAPSVTTVSPETGPEQLAVSPGSAPAEGPAAAQRDRLRPLALAQCSLCGITRPLGLLVPDGGQACADIRWYCKDARSCTERWTTAHPRARTHTPEVPGPVLADAGEAAPEEAPAERPGDVPEPAKSGV
jgi:hypothetical protein